MIEGLDNLFSAAHQHLIPTPLLNKKAPVIRGFLVLAALNQDVPNRRIPRLKRYFAMSTGMGDACNSLWLTLPMYSFSPLNPRLPTTSRS